LGGSPLIFLLWLKITTSKLVYILGLSKPITKSYRKTKVGVAMGLVSSPKFWFPFNISEMAEAIKFKFGIQLGFAKMHKITPKEKVGMALS